jgi:hypothetical protein
MTNVNKFNPSVLKPSLVDADGNLKPSITTDAYVSGAATDGDLKASLIDSAGNIKSCWLDADGNIKPSASNGSDNGDGGGGALTIGEIKPQLMGDGASVSVSPAATGGTTPYVWTATLADGAALSTVNLQINSSTGAITNDGTVTDGHYQVILTVTDDDSTVDTYDLLIVVYDSLASVADADMPTQPAPYEMTTADRVYQLSEDVTVDGAGFAQLANNVTLDLNGHTLTYNDAAADTITNQDFSDWTGSDPDNWTVSGVGTVTEVAKASSYIQPKRMCEGTPRLQGSRMLPAAERQAR